MSTFNHHDDPAAVVAKAMMLRSNNDQLLRLLSAALAQGGPAAEALVSHARQAVCNPCELGATHSRYLVSWVIDIDDAQSPRDAAQRAHACQTRPGTLATCFTVLDTVTGEAHEIDLHDDTPVALRLTLAAASIQAGESRH